MDRGSHDVSPHIFEGLELSSNHLLTSLVAASQGLLPFADGHVQLDLSFTFYQEDIL